MMDVVCGRDYVLFLNVVHRAPDRYALVLLVHHIVTNRGSSKAFLDQLVTFYNDVVAGKSQDVVQIGRKRQYIDFTLWHEHLLRSPEMRPHLEYWINAFKEAPPVSALLPFARPRPHTQSFKTSSLSDNLPAFVFARMKRIAARFNSTVTAIHPSSFSVDPLPLHAAGGFDHPPGSR
jgi:hypothetical protein